VNFSPRASLLSRGTHVLALGDAGRIAYLARREAVRRHAACIETTDLLRALLHEKDVVDRFLSKIDSLRERVMPAAPSGEAVSAGELAFSQQCQEVFGFTIAEAAQLGQPTAPAHLLLGILRVEECAAAKILLSCGLTADAIRAQLCTPPPSSEQGRNYV
jgi:ATP-dependent Clp protease ATP-binding subunit ClpA